MIIERSEIKELKNIPRWIFVFGRRKTGKTFMIKNFIRYDDYFFVKRDKSIISETNKRELSYDLFIEVLRNEIQQNKVIVIDEFHRLGSDFLDFLHYTDKKGKIILISSTLHLSKNLLGSNSPILGLFAEFPLGILKFKDTINALKSQNFNKKELTELAVLLREPITIEYIQNEAEARQTISEAVLQSAKSIPAMIGEIFSEEERSMSSVYEGILRATANGKIISTEIASYLFSKNLIKKDDPSIVQQYLKNLVEFGILKKIQVYNRNKFVYKHISPLAKLFYYADEKYNVSERTLTKGEMKRIVDEIIPKIIEDNLREFLAEHLSLQEAVCEDKDYDVDACLIRFQKVDTAVEIKWKDKISADEVRNANEKLSIVKPKKKLLWVPDKDDVKIKIDGIKIVDISDFITLKIPPIYN